MPAISRFPPPESNPELIGHEAAEAAFLAAYEAGRMPHAWLIAGPRGIGKATLAFRIARFLLAQDRPAPDNAADLFGAPSAPKATAPAGSGLFLAPDHPLYRRIAEGAHSDLRTLRRQVNERTGKLRGEIVIEDVRAAIDFLRLTPAESAWRILIVDAADEMNRNAANALLKILEEPRANTLILLVAHAPGRLLPTLRSRCRRLDLAPLPMAALAEALRRHAPDLDAADGHLVAALAGGSLGRALALADGGIVWFREIAALLAHWPRLDTSRLHKSADQLAGKGGDADFPNAAELLDFWLKRCQVHIALGQAPETELFAGEAAVIRGFADRVGLDRCLTLWEKVTSLFARVASVNLDRKQAWVTAWLAIAMAGEGGALRSSR